RRGGARRRCRQGRGRSGRGQGIARARCAPAPEVRRRQHRVAGRELQRQPRVDARHAGRAVADRAGARRAAAAGDGRHARARRAGGRLPCRPRRGGGVERRGAGLPVRAAHAGAVAEARVGAEGGLSAGLGGARGRCRFGAQGGRCDRGERVVGFKNEECRRRHHRGERRRRGALKMIYNFLYPLAEFFQPLNLFRYLTFRSIAAFLTALVISFLIGGSLIRWLRSKQAHGQPIREDGPVSHIVSKKGTPTMGGLLILIAVSTATLLWADLTNRYVWIVLGVTVAFGVVGFWDDFLKVTKRNPKGVSGKVKLGISIVVAGVAAYFAAQNAPPALRYTLALPFLKDVLLPLGLVGFLAFAMMVIVGASNAVNLTDGLDGLAIGPVIMAAMVFALLAYLVGNVRYTTYLFLWHVPRAGELAVLLSALAGAGLGFLWFNAPPAMVFMGDTGSLAIGGALGATAVVIKHEIVLAIVGGLFVLETVSVIVQVLSYKWTGKRIFRMAPLHHHFEQKGWAEPTIVFRFWIIAAILAMLGLATLKLR